MLVQWGRRTVPHVAVAVVVVVSLEEALLGSLFLLLRGRLRIEVFHLLDFGVGDDTPLVKRLIKRPAIAP